jgi:hypothetical protein
MQQDKNFTVRLKAAIDKRLVESSMVSTSPSLSIDEYSSDEKKALNKFMESLGEITLDYLQGESKTTTPFIDSNCDCKNRRRLMEEFECTECGKLHMA